MHIEETPLSGLLVIQPKVFEDSRGYFYETFNKEFFQKNGLESDFAQDNESLSKKNTLRGLHFQNPPYDQAKLVRVVKGAVRDVAVDIRKNSPTYGQSFLIDLTEKNKTMLWIPSGFAHGFLTLENDTVFFYKCSRLYNKASEGGVIWNDPRLNIDWGIEQPILSEKDKQLPFWDQFKSLF